MRVMRLRPSILVGTNIDNPLSALFGQALKGYLVGSSDTSCRRTRDEDVADTCIPLNTEGGEERSTSARALKFEEIAQALSFRVLVRKALSSFARHHFIAKVKFRVKDAIDPAWSLATAMANASKSKR